MGFYEKAREAMKYRIVIERTMKRCIEFEADHQNAAINKGHQIYEEVKNQNDGFETSQDWWVEREKWEELGE